MDDIRQIFERVTEHYNDPIRIGSRCEANVYYRVDLLSPDDLEVCANYVADRINKVCQPQFPTKLVNLPGGYTGLAEILSQELGAPGEPLELVEIKSLEPENGWSKALKNEDVVLVNDVITTARSCLEAHTRVTMLGANILCWAALIDRTFGPGPVPVVAAHNGAPVTLLEEM